LTTLRGGAGLDWARYLAQTALGQARKKEKQMKNTIRLFALSIWLMKLWLLDKLQRL
jgi:hypothetical protein